jgi:hypothetical protein
MGTRTIWWGNTRLMPRRLHMNERFVNTGLSAPIAVAVSGITYSS